MAYFEQNFLKISGVATSNPRSGRGHFLTDPAYAFWPQYFRRSAVTATRSIGSGRPITGSKTSGSGQKFRSAFMSELFVANGSEYTDKRMRPTIARTIPPCIHRVTKPGLSQSYTSWDLVFICATLAASVIVLYIYINATSVTLKTRQSCHRRSRCIRYYVASHCPKG